MKICIVGGIFDAPDHRKSKHLITPETVLLAGLERQGVDVEAVGHARFEPSDAYDIVHVHHLGKAALKMAASRGRSRFVFTGHNGLIVTGHERSWLRRQAFDYVLSQADTFVALSQAEGDYFRGRGLANDVCVIPNGIPADVFGVRTDADSGASPTNGKPRYDLLYVGQLIDWKGVDFLLRAVQQLRQQRDVRLRLVYHNAELENDLKQLARELGIAEQVEFAGIRGPAELAQEYRRADILVLPSFADCLPSVVTEALLSGTPVVAGGVCGVPEQVGPYGRVVPPGDVAALAAAIDSVLTDRPRFRSLAEEMHAYAERKFRPEAMVRAHQELYESLVAGRLGSKRGRRWLDPLVRCAVSVYWSRGRRHAG